MFPEMQGFQSKPRTVLDKRGQLITLLGQDTTSLSFGFFFFICEAGIIIPVSCVTLRIGASVQKVPEAMSEIS